jgi:hypothetical protein
MMIVNELGYGFLPIEFVAAYLERHELVAWDKAKTYPYLQVLAWFPRHQYQGYFSALIHACY